MSGSRKSLIVFVILGTLSLLWMLVAGCQSIPTPPVKYSQTQQ